MGLHCASSQPLLSCVPPIPPQPPSECGFLMPSACLFITFVTFFFWHGSKAGVGSFLGGMVATLAVESDLLRQPSKSRRLED